MNMNFNDIIKVLREPIPIGAVQSISPKNLIAAWYISNRIICKPSNNNLETQRNWEVIYKREAVKMVEALSSKTYVHKNAVVEIIRRFMTERGDAWRNDLGFIVISDIGLDTNKLVNEVEGKVSTNDMGIICDIIMDLSVYKRGWDVFNLFATDSLDSIMTDISEHINSHKAMIDKTELERRRLLRLVINYANTALQYLRHMYKGKYVRSRDNWMTRDFLMRVAKDEDCVNMVIARLNDFHHVMEDSEKLRDRKPTTPLVLMR